MPHLKNKLSGDYNKTHIERNFVSKVAKNMGFYTSFFFHYYSSLLLVMIEMSVNFYNCTRHWPIHRTFESYFPLYIKKTTLNFWEIPSICDSVDF